MTTPGRRHELHKTVVVVMGVAGSGKSTIAQLLAQHLGWTSIEGDDLHPPQNVAKMAAGTPLSDAEREPWLRAISQRIDQTEGNQLFNTTPRLNEAFNNEAQRRRWLARVGNKWWTASGLD
jgi:gluconokinase